MDPEQTNRSPEQILGLVRRRAPWVLLCVILVAGATFVFSRDQAKTYTATAKLLFQNNQRSQEVAGLQGTSNNESPQTQQNTNVKVVQLGDDGRVAANAAHQLGGGLTGAEVSGALSVNPEGESNVIDVSAEASSPRLARKIANAYTAQFAADQQSSDHKYYASALKLVDKQLAGLSKKERSGPAGSELQARARALGVLSELRNSNVQVAQKASLPSSPSSPRVRRNTILGAIVGFLLGLALAFLLERLDWRIREPEDLEAIYRLPLLGVVPESRVLSRSARSFRPGRRKRRLQQALPVREEEAFQLIRAHLRYFNVDRELRTLLVASAAQGDGKTTVARHLASAAARVGWVVLLLEADLRNPTLAAQLDLQPGPGLSDVLIGEISIRGATQIVDLDFPSADRPDNVGPDGQMRIGERVLDVLPAGVPLPPNPGKLIESPWMEGLLDQVRSTYDLVVIDTPPMAAVSDVFPLLSKVDGVIVVGRVGRNRRDVAERMSQILARAQAPLLGVVANGFKARHLRSHGYAYDGAQVPARGDASAAGELLVPSEQLSDGRSSPEEPVALVSAPGASGAEAARANGSRRRSRRAQRHVETRAEPANPADPPHSS